MDISVTPKGHWYVTFCYSDVELSGMFPFLVNSPFPSAVVLLNESPMTSQSMQLTSNIDQVTHFRFVIMVYVSNTDRQTCHVIGVHLKRRIGGFIFFHLLIFFFLFLFHSFLFIFLIHLPSSILLNIYIGRLISIALCVYSSLSSFIYPYRTQLFTHLLQHEGT